MARITDSPDRWQAKTGEAVLPGAGRKARNPMPRSSCMSALALILITSVATPNTRAVAQTCVGDCNGDERVDVNELIVGVNIALGGLAITQCASLDDGAGTVTVDRLVLAVTNALNGCGGSPTPGEGTPTPTTTPVPGSASPTVTPPSGASVSMWTVDNYEVAESDCGDVVKDSVRSALEGLGPDFTVRQSGDQVEIDGSHGLAFEGTVDADETAHVQRRISGSVATCDYDVDVDAVANLSTSSTTATYAGAVHFSGFCLEFSDCAVQVTARWTRVDGG
jgi:hypothetical protein